VRRFTEKPERLLRAAAPSPEIRENPRRFWATIRMPYRKCRPHHRGALRVLVETEGRKMAATETPVLFVKKMLSMVLLILGMLLTATGVYTGSAALITLGLMMFAVGIGLLILKIMRRNQNVHP
jgi:hypothetical protein